MKLDIDAIDWDELSLEELTRIRDNAQKAIISYEKRKLEAAQAKLNEMAKELGFASATEVFGSQRADSAGKRKTEKAEKPPSPPYYRDPNDHSRTSARLGARPKWLKEKLDAGVPREELTIEWQDANLKK